MSDEKAVPTKPGAYYLEDGRPSIVRALHGVGLSCMTHGTGWVNVESRDWATRDGDVVPVPSLEELTALRWARDDRARAIGEKHAMKAERDDAIAERAELRTAYREVGSRYGALLSALDVPEKAEAMEWAAALVAAGAICERAAVGLAQTYEVERAGRALDALRNPKPPRPLPDGVGLWHLAGGGVAEVSDGPGCAGWCVDAVIGNLDAEDRLILAHGAGMTAGNRPLHVSELEWLAGPDGKAVRCTPPEVDRG